MKWNDDYRIEVDFIDSQHKAWFDRVAEFEAIINQGCTASEIARTLKFLVEYSQKHLVDEERYMREIKYPHLDKQIRHHKVFMHHIVGVLTDLKYGKDIRPSKLLHFMSTWIRQHILEHDRLIGAFVSAQNEQSDVGNPGPPQDSSDLLQRRLKELAGLAKSDLITEKEYTAKKKELLSQFAVNESISGGGGLVETGRKLSALHKRDLISMEELNETKALLAEKVDLDAEMRLHDTSRQKLDALNALLKDGLVTTEQFESSKAEILHNI